MVAQAAGARPVFPVGHRPVVRTPLEAHHKVAQQPLALPPPVNRAAKRPKATRAPKTPHQAARNKAADPPVGLKPAAKAAASAHPARAAAAAQAA